jgi:hypothetical protein
MVRGDAPLFRYDPARCQSPTVVIDEYDRYWMIRHRLVSGPHDVAARQQGLRRISGTVWMRVKIA